MQDQHFLLNGLHSRNLHWKRAHVWREDDRDASMVNGKAASKDDSMAPHTQQYREMTVVSGPATGDGFSREGFDVDDVRDNGYETAAQALLSGIATSSTMNKSHYDSPDTTVTKQESQGDHKEQQQQQHPHASMNRKGHAEASSVRSSVGLFVKSNVRWINSYWSAVARQQRQRSRRKNSAANALGDRQEEEDLLEKSAHAEAVSNSLLHRSHSAVFMEQDPTQTIGSGRGETNRGTEIELATMEEGGGDVAAGGALSTRELIRRGGETEALLPGSRAGPVGGEGGGDSLKVGTLRRGGVMRATTGDLKMLIREEEPSREEQTQQQEDGESKAGDQEAGAATMGSQGASTGSRSRWAMRPRRSVLPVLHDPGDNVEQWTRDGQAYGNFKVLGIEIGHLQDSHQAFVCVGGVFTFLLIYGYMQEYLVVQIFQRELGLFLTLLQFFGYAACAWLRRSLHKETEKKIPLRTYFGLGFCQACMQGLTNVSMMYLNYPAKVLFKSSRMVPIMCFGVVCQGRKYSRRDYIVVFLIVTGLATFMNAETRASEHTETPFSLIGVAFISMALVIDAAIINYQEELMMTYEACQDELIMFSYLCGTVFVASLCLITGDLKEGMVFLHHKGIWSILAVMLFAGAGFLGVSCVAALTKRFGALHSAITTTARKAVTLLLSFLVFPDKPFSVQHGVGAAVFILGLVTKIFGRWDRSQAPAISSTTTSPSATPFINVRDRKHLANDQDSTDQLDASAAAPLLSGSGGGGGARSNGGGHGAKGSGGDVDRTHSPSPIGKGDSRSMPFTSGGNPVRQRSIPRNVGLRALAEGGLDLGVVANGRGNRWVRQQLASETAAVVENGSSRPLSGRAQSPRRRAQSPRRMSSPPVSGLSFRMPV